MLIPKDTISHLQESINHGGQEMFDLVPTLLAKIINNRLWAGRQDRAGKPFSSFEAFVEHDLWQGLESTIEDLKAFCRKREDVGRLIDAEVMPIAEHGETGRGRSNRRYNVTSIRGNNPTYTLKRLKRDRPDLAAKVVAGEMSANAAAIEAGFRKKPTFTCPECGHKFTK